MKVLYIEWADATGMAGWMSLEDQNNWDWAPIMVKSIGILVNENKEQVTICHSLAEHGHINGYITIPKGWIKKRRTIKL